MEPSKKCVPLINVTRQQGVAPLRITVPAQLTEDCYIFYNVINAIINAVEVPVKVMSTPTFGKLVNGMWNGAMGELANNETDVLMPGYSITYDRFPWIIPSPTFGYGSPIAILSGKISKNIYRNDFHVFNTFSTGVWTGIMISIIFIAITDYFIHERLMEKIISKIFLAYAFFIRQGSGQVVSYCCVKHVTLWGISLLCFSVLGYYFGNYILTDQLNNSFIIIDSMHDLAKLLESTKTNISVVAASYGILIWKLMESCKEESFQKVYKHLTPVMNFNYDDIYHGRTVAIQFDIILESVMNANKHIGFHLSRDQYFGTALCIYYSKGIDKKAKEKIDSVIYSIYETGINDIYSALTFQSKVRVKQDRDDNNQSNDMDSIKGLFYLLFGINLSTIIILILEKIIHNSCNLTNII